MKKAKNIFHFSLSTLHFALSSGQAMIMAIVFMTVILILAASLFGRTADFLRFGSGFILQEQAIQMAEAGVDWGIWYLNQNAGANPTPSPRPVGTTGEYLVTVTDKTSSLKEITSTGYFPNSTNPYAKRTIKAQALVDSSQVSFRYAAQVGTGGVNMKNSSTINGTVYTNGSLTGSGSSTINGEAYTVGTISSPDPTFFCGQPTCKHPGSPPTNMPTINYQQWKDAAEAGGVINCGGGTCSYTGGTTTLGPKKLVGNLVVSNFAAIDMQGPIWVTGNVTVQNSAEVRLDPSFGSNGTVLITDGTVNTANSGKFVPTDATPKGYILVVTTSTLNAAVRVQNSGQNAIFYALEGGAELENTATVTALVAKRLELENSATLTYDSGLASASFVIGPGASWAIKKGTYRFTSSP